MASNINVLLVIFGMIIAGNSETEPECHEKPFWSLARLCYDDEPTDPLTTHCIFQKTGILNTNGSLNVDKMEELILPYVIKGRETSAREYIAAVRLCVQEVPPSEREKNALKKLVECGAYKKAANQFIHSVCLNPPNL